MSQSRIEWTDRTWNVAVGCTRVSEGCRNCYAERQAVRHEGRAYRGVVRSTPQGPRWTGAVQLHEARLEEPLGWQRPARVFVCSMGDLFHEDVPDAFLDRVFAVMALCRQHQFQVLTKRPQRARAYLGGGGLCEARERIAMRTGLYGALPWPLPNVWLGTSVEDQATAEARVPHLLDGRLHNAFPEVRPHA